MALLPGQFSTSLDLIEGALRMIGLLADGEHAEGIVANNCLVVANELMDSLNAQKLATFTINRNIVVPAVLKQAYTLGTGGDFNLPRPTRLSYASVISLQNASQPLELPLDILSDAEWLEIPVKNLSSQLPRQVWNDGGFPFMTLNYYPIPNTQVNFGLYMWAALTSFTDLGATQYSYPPGYLRMLRSNLAVEFDGEYGGDPAKMPRVERIALESKAIVKSQNIQPIVMECDEMFSDGQSDLFNWLTGESVGR